VKRAAVASAIGLAGIVPHAIDDYRFGGPERFGVPEESFLWAFGLFAVVTALAAVWAASGSRTGLRWVFAVGVTWVVVATADHYQAFVSAVFREGFASRVWVWWIVVSQAVAAVLAWRELRATE
jgi:hypothetical protein